MKSTWIMLGTLISAALLASVAHRASGQEPHGHEGAAATTQPNNDPKFARPGPVHERLARRVGKYKTAIRYKSKAPTGDLVSDGAATLRMTLDGRFLIDENSGVLMGRNFSGLRMTGYNNATGRYEAAWADTNATGLVQLLGTSKDDGKTVEYTAKLETADGPLEFKAIDRQVDDDSFVITILSGGSVLDVTYTRAR